MRIFAVAALIAVAGPVAASTPENWAAMHQRADRACVALSGLSRPELLAERMSFSDTIGMEARMIRGKDSRGRNQRKLCLYNRRTGKAEVQDAPIWFGATRRP